MEVLSIFHHMSIGVQPLFYIKFFTFSDAHAATRSVRFVRSYSDNIAKMQMEIKIVPALADNYMYLLIDNVTREAAAVDPAEPEKLHDILKAEKLSLRKILTTHHHADHSMGNIKLAEMYKNESLDVLGGDDRVPAMNHFVKDNEYVKLGELNIKCLSTPCHTTGHVCYYVTSPQGDSAVFTGDTLFQGGCGRFFEGTAEQMYTALYEKLGKLPDETKVYCGHEYTLQNLAFAHLIEPSNADVVNRIKWAKEQRFTLTPTVPSTIGQEKTWNPFMRVHCADVQSYAQEKEPILTMKKIRKDKDSFKL